MKYIVNKGRRVVATVEMGEPDVEYLKKNNLFVVEQPEVVNLPADYVGGRIVPHQKTKKELARTRLARRQIELEKAIKNEIRRIALERIKNREYK